jgi:hypothetical protein
MAVVNNVGTAFLPPDVDVYVVQEADNPSADYFVFPACAGQGRRVHRCGFDDLPPAEALAGSVLVFVRYLSPKWMRAVESMRARLAALVFFMDDDVLDPAAASGMPWRYRYKLYRLAARHRDWLRRQRASLWVSTPWLASKYAPLQPHCIAPSPIPPLARACRVFYHGTASHDAEVRWLRPVLETALRQEPMLSFEIVGGPGVNRLYRGLPRVTVVHPMKWPAYQAFMDTGGRHIGLAPLLDLPFNKARSATKFFDITRCGGVGLYAAGDIYGSLVRDGNNGLLLPMEQDTWSAALVALARDPARRKRMLASARTVASGAHARYA